jgi:hypothetical protein
LGDYEVDYLPMTMKITGFGPIDSGHPHINNRPVWKEFSGTASPS